MPLINNEVVEGDETFLGQLTLMPASQPGVQLGIDEATVLIQDDDGRKL